MSDVIHRYFLGFTDDEGWARFRPGEAATFGFTEARRGASESLRAGDRILAYLKGRMAWCGILEVIQDEVPDEAAAAESRKNYPARVPVIPLVTLPPFKAVLITDEDVWNSLSFTRGKKRSQGWNGKIRSDLNRIEDGDAEVLVRAIRARYGLPIGAEAGDTENAAPSGREDFREWINAQVVARRGQEDFRRKLMAAYGGRCAISGCAVPDVLEAAHVTRYLGAHSNPVTNGMLLRADLHTLYDCGLLGIDPGTRKVMIAPALRGSEYEAFEGAVLRETSPARARPSRDGLQDHLDYVFLPTRRNGDT